jgi:hypothetical protein
MGDIKAGSLGRPISGIRQAIERIYRLVKSAEYNKFCF